MWNTGGTPVSTLPGSPPIISLTCCLALVADSWQGVHPISSFPVAAQHACYDINARLNVSHVKALDETHRLWPGCDIRR